ncbi:aryl hydrocarbon receptor-like isoform X2 [Myxocyprinus asiaticus]|uniref:aryl hydrocarbon receptor-like isoform X2 n=1 Tax=Myxocyprinus asiaticus TaxID=70543 RepID=UPI00222250DE|nr:aryl hydrocarbon receptor-like isoform X2 [Myxocyprinus asiaticus]
MVLNGFVLVVTSRGTIFYASSTIEDYLGFHQSDLIHQSIYELIHTEDRAEFQKQLHWALSPSGTSDAGQLVQASHDVPLPQMYYSPERLPPENSTFLERNFVCRLRCLLDNSSRFLAMNFQGRLKFLYGQNERTEDGKPVPPQLALFALACPLQPPAILEIRTKSFMFRTKHKLDFTPTGCDAKGKIILGYTEAELCYRGSGYQFIHAADMLYCAENHMRMMKMGESGLTVFRLLTKHNLWVWVQASARLIYKNGQPDFIIASQRAITDEEGEENLRKRTMTLPFNFTTGEAVLYDMNLSRSLSNSPNSNPSAHSNSNQPKSTGTVDPDSLLGSMLKQDESIYVCPAGSDENSVSIQGLGKEDLGGIFSSDWQESVLSLSESSLFKQEPIISSGGDDSCEILSFMRSLGISPEDLKLLQQDEVFLRVDFDGCSNMADLTDGVLSYVQQSLRKKTDSIMSSDAQANLGKHVQTPPWHQQPYSCNSLILGSQEQQMSFIMEHPEPKIQHFTQIQTQLQNTGDIPKHQNNPQRHQHTMSHPYNGLGTSQYELSNVTVQKQQIQMVSQQLQTAHSKKQQPHCPYLPPPYQHVCNTLNDAQVCGNLTEVLTSNTQQVSPFFQPELQQPGCFYLETSPVELEHPYRNHLNNVSISCSQEHSSSYITSGDADEGEFTAHDLEELLNSLDAGGIERKGQPGHNGGAGIGPSLDQQAYIGQFQYGSHTNYAMENNTAHPAQLTNQHQNKSRPHPNLSLGGYL